MRRACWAISMSRISLQSACAYPLRENAGPCDAPCSLTPPSAIKDTPPRRVACQAIVLAPTADTSLDTLVPNQHRIHSGITEYLDRRFPVGIFLHALTFEFFGVANSPVRHLVYGTQRQQVFDFILREFVDRHIVLYSFATRISDCMYFQAPIMHCERATGSVVTESAPYHQAD